MSLTGVVNGDIVLCDVRGQQFYAIVAHRIKGKREIEVTPIDNRNGGMRVVKSTQVKRRYKRMGN